MKENLIAQNDSEWPKSIWSLNPNSMSGFAILLVTFSIANYCSTITYIWSDQLIAIRPQVGLAVAICLLFGKNSLWSLSIAHFASSLLIRAWSFKQPFWGSAVMAGNIGGEILAIYFITHAVVGGKIDFRNWKHLLAFIAISAGASVASGFLFALPYAWPRTTVFFSNWQVWTLSTATACALVTPAFGLIATADLKGILSAKIAIVACFIGLTVVLALTFFYAAFSALATIILTVLFVAILFGVEMAALSLLLIDVGFTATIGMGNRPPSFPPFTVGQEMLYLQSTLALAALVLLPAAAAISKRNDLIQEIKSALHKVSMTRLQLQESEARYRLLAENASDIIVRTNLSGEVLYVSPSILRILGYDPSEVIGSSGLPFIHPSDHALIPPPVAVPDYRDGSLNIVKLRFRGLHKDGSIITFECHSNAAFNADGTWMGFISILRDVTEKMRSEVKLEELRAEFAHLERINTMSQMSVGISHELNQPLAAVVNYCSAAKQYSKYPDPAFAASRLDEAINKAVEQALRASSILRSLRDFSERRPQKTKPENLHDVIQDAMKMTLMGKEPRVSIEIVERDHLGPSQVLMDRVQIQQVIQNLLRNALDATALGAAKVILVSLGVEKEQFAYFEVEDNGPGVPCQQLPKLFQSFSTTKVEGMGIGLALSKTLVESHGGTIELTKNSTAGACFRVRLPIHVR